MAPGLIKLCLILWISGAQCCRSRSGEDTERVYSHQGQEPEYVKEKEEAVAGKEAVVDINVEDESRQREVGEYKVGKKWEKYFAHPPLDATALTCVVLQTIFGRRNEVDVVCAMHNE